MKNRSNTINIKRKPKSYSYIKKTPNKSKTHSNALITFTSNLDWIISQLKNKCLVTKYVEEDIKYLGIKREKEPLNKIYIPMKCFCDTNFSKLKSHIEWYGTYGIAMYKKWGIKKGLQQVSYMNGYSKINRDAKYVLNKLFNNKINEEIIKAFLLHYLLYIKPYKGKAYKRGEKDIIDKCFGDENEWRYIPKLSKEFIDSGINYLLTNKNNIDKYNEILLSDKETSLKFDYKDIKYIIVKNKKDLFLISEEINNFEIDNKEKFMLFSKILIWDEIEEDI